MGIKPGTIKGWPENDDGVGFFGDGGSAGIGRPIDYTEFV